MSLGSEIQKTRPAVIVSNDASRPLAVVNHTANAKQRLAIRYRKYFWSNFSKGFTPLIRVHPCSSVAIHSC
jgi:hypothetical protein